MRKWSWLDIINAAVVMMWLKGRVIKATEPKASTIHPSIVQRKIGYCKGIITAGNHSDENECGQMYVDYPRLSANLNNCDTFRDRQCYQSANRNIDRLDRISRRLSRISSQC